ncbi:copper chaperone PCu(A)C [Sedimentitalea sp. XS_ASV28]|uniref:copper chaperone PCu(A)C n=1 Tax=Sedimentitalea sp. XS_ASV28 TaxID=3241296 RepID=UPI0035159C3E
MNKLRYLNGLAVLVLAAGLSAPAFAGSEDVSVDKPWARASIGVKRPGAAYMIVRNNGQDAVTLTGLATPLAMMPEIHETKTNADGVSSMTPVDEITIEAGESVALEPGGLHAMLMKLQNPMTEGESFPLTLTFADGGEVIVEVPILGIAARGPEG